MSESRCRGCKQELMAQAAYCSPDCRADHYGRTLFTLRKEVAQLRTLLDMEDGDYAVQIEINKWKAEVERLKGEYREMVDLFPGGMPGTSNLKHLIKAMFYNLTAAEKERDEAREDLSETRAAHAHLCHRLKEALGLKNWPKIEGYFVDGVACLVEQHFAESANSKLREALVKAWDRFDRIGNNSTGIDADYLRKSARDGAAEARAALSEGSGGEGKE